MSRFHLSIISSSLLSARAHKLFRHKTLLRFYESTVMTQYRAVVNASVGPNDLKIELLLVIIITLTIQRLRNGFLRFAR